ncbi:MAG: DUF4365 domain-containing protein [Candidatus Melainabacteria bacterium]|nr:DUF4365 domain-containing protein [Candidatus Melainabacteria bacterium]
MSRPAQYPNNDSQESKSLKILQNLLDEEWVKDHFEKRDKRPNTDGTVELVDLKDIPTGKLEVQIKTLKGGANSFQCSSKLYAYSKVTTAPLLLICVDGSKNLAYWKHIYSDMKEANGKQSQKSFVVNFDGSIDASKTYILAWNAICKNIQSRLLTGGSVMGLSMQEIKQGFKLYPRREQALWEILLSVEKNKKDLKAAIKYVENNISSGWSEFGKELQKQTTTKNSNQGKVTYQLKIHQFEGELRCQSAILFFRISGTIITLEFRVDGRFEGLDGEVFWYLPKETGSPGKLNWLDIERKDIYWSSQKLADFCITRLIELNH